MPRTIDDGFRDFLSHLTPTPGESQAAKTHRASIEACLDANFGVLRFFRTGSFGNGTSISGYSDVDYFASVRAIPSSESGVALSKVRDVLNRRFPSAGVRVSSPAVVVPFGREAKETTEVVLATVTDMRSNNFIYDIADCIGGGWKRSSPEIHKEYVKGIDERFGGMVRPLIRFIKAWKFYQNVPISSFYLELQIAEYAMRQSNIIYDLDVRYALGHLNQIGLGQMVDPTGISGFVVASTTASRLDEARSKLATAVVLANNAVEAASNSDAKSAFEWWNRLYNGQFSSYYR